MKKGMANYIEIGGSNDEFMNVKQYFENSNCCSIETSELDDIEAITRYIKNNISFLETSNILVLGCGDGSKERSIFIKSNSVNIYLNDFSRTLIKQAQINNPNAVCICSDISDISEKVGDKKFDLIYSYSVLQYFKKRDIKKINVSLFSMLNPNGQIIHLNVPDKRRKIIYRLNKAIVMKNIKYIFPGNDFTDEFSYWVSPRSFEKIKKSTITFVTPSYDWERYNVIIKRR